MEIWLIRNGEKYGPFPDYDIRRRIEAGELEADTRGWHEGLAQWLPLAEIPIFKNEFEKRAEAIIEAAATPPDSPPPAAIKPPPLPEKPKIIRRFWARWFDINLYLALWWLILYYSNRNIEAIFPDPLINLIQLIPWFVLETLLIHHFATTPGKWLLGIRVLNADGSKLSLGQSTQRAVRVFLIGIGLGWGIVSLFCQGLSAFTTNRLGAPLWDHAGKHRVSHEKLSPWKLPLVTILFFASTYLQFAVLYPYTSKVITQQSPELKALFQANPPPHLPPRH